MTEPRKYRTKPVEVEVMGPMIIEGDVNVNQIAKWCGGKITRRFSIMVPTGEGEYVAMPGDYIARDNRGKFAIIDSKTFEATYEPVEPRQTMITYRRADGELVFDEYELVTQLDWFYTDDGPIDFIEETWALEESKTITVNDDEPVEDE